jgi:adenylate kinase
VKRRVVLLGPPASGKGTQAALIQAKYQIPVTSPGAILREEKKAGTPLGRQADELTREGKLLPDSIIVGLVERWLVQQHDGFVFDGFPRTLGQAAALDDLLAKKQSELDVVISLDADRDVLEDRVLHRVMCSECGAIFRIGQHVASLADPCPICGGSLTKRRDDTIEVFSARFAEYTAKTFPLLNYYAGRQLLHRVSSASTPELVFSQVSAILEGK